jgi:hypothetical protein
MIGGRRWLWVTVAALMGGCDGRDINAPALEAALATTRQQPPEGSAIETPLGVWMRDAGPHRATISIDYRLDDEGGRTTRMFLQRSIDRYVEGPFRVEERRTWFETGAGREAHRSEAEAVYDGKRLVVRPGAGPWRERETWAGQQWELLRSTYAPIFEFSEAFEPYAKRTLDKEGLAVAGVAGQAFVLSLRPDVIPQRLTLEALASLRDHDQRWVRWLTATHRPMELTGFEVRPTAGGDPMACQWIIKGSVTEGAFAASFRLTLDVAISDLPPARPIALPGQDEILPTHRPRIWAMIEDVLGERITPLYRRAAGQPASRDASPTSSEAPGGAGSSAVARSGGR